MNLCPLFPASAAVCGVASRADSAATRFTLRLENRRALVEVVRHAGWEPVTPHPDHQSGILLIRAAFGMSRHTTPDSLQRSFRRRGVSLTAYPFGIVRASLPGTRCTADWSEAAHAAFRHVRIDLDGEGTGPSRSGSERGVSPRSHAASMHDGAF